METPERIAWAMETYLTPFTAGANPQTIKKYRIAAGPATGKLEDHNAR